MPQGIPRFAVEPLHRVLHQRVVRLLQQVSLAQSSGVQSGTHAGEAEETKGWAKARGKRLTSRLKNSSAVRDYAYRELKKLQSTVKSRDAAEKDLYDNAYNQFADLPPPDPEGHENCWPPSIAACERILDVPELSRYLVHVCARGCIHWWTFMPDASSHFDTCQGCLHCRCPHCDAPRFVKGKQGTVGAQSCWLFPDAIQDLFLNPDWARAVPTGQSPRDTGMGKRWVRRSPLLQTVQSMHVSKMSYLASDMTWRRCVSRVEVQFSVQMPLQVQRFSFLCRSFFSILGVMEYNC
jgi:hypothetical protein